MVIKMSSKFNRERLLTTRVLSEIYSACVSIAQEFAILGDIATAAKLVDFLLSHHPTNEQRTAVQHLSFAFDCCQEWPNQIGSDERSEEYLSNIARGTSAWPYNFPESDRHFSPATANKLLQQYTDPGSSWSDEPLGLPSNNKSKALAAALAIAVVCTKERDAEDDAQVQHVLGSVAARFHADGQIESLTEHQSLWPLLARGALARKLNLSLDKMSELSTEVVETFEQRFRTRRQKHSNESKSTQELLQMLSDHSDANRRNDPEGEEVDFPWGLLREPANDDEIEALTMRLNRVLPNDYTEFLRLTNGMEPIWGGTMYTYDPPLYRSEEVGWSDLLSENKVELFHLSFGKVGYLARDERDGALEWPTFTNAILIGVEDIFNILMLPPEVMAEVVTAYEGILEDENVQESWKKEIRESIESKFGSLEELKKHDWCVFEDSEGETTCYGSFRTWLEAKEIRATDVAAQNSPSGPQSPYCFSYGLRLDSTLSLR